MPLRQKEDIDDYGAPIAFLRGDQVMVREGLSGVFLNNGDRLPAHFELDTGKKRPFLKDGLWCTPDDGKVWYALLARREDERELLDALSLTRANVFPIRWRPGRPLHHDDPGPYPVDWIITRAAV